MTEELFATDAYLRAFDAAVADLDREQGRVRWPAPRSVPAATASRTTSERRRDRGRARRRGRVGAAALRTALAAGPDIDVLGAAGDGAEVPDLVARLHPDVVPMDVRMRAVAGIAAAPGAPRVLVRTAFGNDGAV